MNFKIHNCMRALEDSQKLIEESLKQLQNANTSITNDLNELMNRGWKDKNYENLKNVFFERTQDINNLMKSMESSANELKTRSQLIKKYYAVPF